MVRRIQVQGISLLAVCSSLLAISPLFIPRIPRAWCAALAAWAGIQSMAAFVAFSWSIPRRDKSFFVLFLGDALVRLAVLGMAAAALTKTQTPLGAPLVFLAIGYLFLSCAQIPFLHRVPQ